MKLGLNILAVLIFSNFASAEDLSRYSEAVVKQVKLDWSKSNFLVSVVYRGCGNEDFKLEAKQCISNHCDIELIYSNTEPCRAVNQTTLVFPIADLNLKWAQIYNTCTVSIEGAKDWLQIEPLEPIQLPSSLCR